VGPTPRRAVFQTVSRGLAIGLHVFYSEAVREKVRATYKIALETKFGRVTFFCSGSTPALPSFRSSPRKVAHNTLFDEVKSTIPGLV